MKGIPQTSSVLTLRAEACLFLLAQPPTGETPAGGILWEAELRGAEGLGRGSATYPKHWQVLDSKPQFPLL